MHSVNLYWFIYLYVLWSISAVSLYQFRSGETLIDYSLYRGLSFLFLPRLPAFLVCLSKSISVFSCSYIMMPFRSSLTVYFTQQVFTLLVFEYDPYLRSGWYKARSVFRLIQVRNEKNVLHHAEFTVPFF